MRDDGDLAVGHIMPRTGSWPVPCAVHLCEYHLLNKGRQALARDGIGFGDPLSPLLHASLHSRPEWGRFEPQAQASGGQACGYSVNGPTSHSDATVNPAVRRAARLASS